VILTFAIITKYTTLL